MTAPSPAPAPATPPAYVGFWLRLWASLIDSAWMLLLLSPLAALLPGSTELSLDQLLGDPTQLSTQALAAQLLPGGRDLVVWVLVPALLVLAFWDRTAATPGKMAIHARIVDSRTFGAPSRRQWLLRYLGYLLATLPCGLGLIWVGIDPRKQGWHDKLAGTVVIRARRRA